MKKRILSLALVFAIIMAFVPNMVYAERLQYGDLTYEKYDDHIEIIDCNYMATSVDIPAEIYGLPVTSIGDEAFTLCKDLTSITIGNSVTTIGDEAFECCYSLTSITIPNSVTSIGPRAFLDCASLNISVSQDNKNYCDIDGVLFNKDKTEIIAYAKDRIQPEYTIPSSVTSISCC